MQYNLIIQIENNQPKGHPILLENFQQAFPHLDLNNLPDTFAWFERVEQPNLGPYEKNATLTYEFVDNIVKDVWRVEKLTEQEKLAKINNCKAEWQSKGFPSWNFNEELCQFLPPISYPDDDKRYVWDESTVSWKERILSNN